MGKNSSYVYVRKNKSGEFLYLCLINGKRVSTGLESNPANLQKSKKILIMLNNKIEEEEKLIQPLPSSESPTSIKSIHNEFILHLINKNLASKSIKHHQYIYNLYYENEEFDINDKLLHNGKMVYKAELIFKSKIIEYQNKYESGSLRSHLANVSQFLLYAYQNEHIEKPIFINNKYKYLIAQDNYSSPQHYSKEELELLFIHSLYKDKELTMLILFLLYTGCRIMECLNLKWSDIDFEERVFVVPNKKKRNIMDYMPVSTKLLRLLKIIQHYRTHKYKIKHRDKKNTNIYVFRYNAFGSQKTFVDLQNELNIKSKKRLFHSLRKNYAQMLLDAQPKFNINDSTVETLIRHKDIGLTASVYAKRKAQLYIGILDQLLSTKYNNISV